MAEELQINEQLTISLDEIRYTVSRAGGPGGQHVNKTNSRVILRFDVDASPSLDDAQRRRIHARLATRIGRDGELRVICGRNRSQAANRREALERFVELLREALRRRRRRVATKVSKAARRRRLDQKRRRGKVKRERGRPDAAGD